MIDKKESSNRKDKLRLLFGLVLIVLIVAGSIVSLYNVNAQNQTSDVILRKERGSPDTGFAEIKVHVAGAVNESGVYTLTKGMRVEDGIKAAGGMSDKADVSYVEKYLNLAARLLDSEKIYIPTIDETKEAGLQQFHAKESVLGESQEVSSRKVNINTASVEQLLNAKLYRIGPKTAQKIVDYRTENGPFSSIEAITNVRGIGEKTFERVKGRITVN